MTPEQFQALRREWADRLRAEGFRDIESPSGAIKGQVAELVRRRREGWAEEADARRAVLDSPKLGGPWDRTCAALYAEGLSERAIARKTGMGRNLVDRTVVRIRKLMAEQLQLEPRAGRPRDPDSLRSEGMALYLRLSPAAAMALDHCRAAMGVSGQDVARRAVILLAKALRAGAK